MRRHLVLASLLLFPVIAFCEAAEYKLDPNHTSVNWEISHFDFSHFYGKWMANGTLMFDAEDPKKSKVNVDIKVKDFITGNEKLDNHLKGKDFFEVDQFPNATFVSDKVEANGKKISKIHGTLTVRGVSKPVVLDVIAHKAGKNMMGKDTVGFRAQTKVKRSDFGMTQFLPGLGDEVKLDIEVEANK
jgi:polyisoprenoid-binding protein YceI